MNKYLVLLLLLLVGLLIVMIGLTLVSHTPENTSIPLIDADEAWCESMVEKPNLAWTDSETRLFASSCLYE
ncbi:MAG: hypothetical protein CL693_01575 [Cellvibrionaceae bacterium]|nr:hypothetical protein [Cellvibrionaceae bacterium]